MLVALLTGLGPGLLATALAGSLAAYFAVEPLGGFAVADRSEDITLAVFAATGVFMSLVAEHYRRGQRLITAHKEQRALSEGKLLYRTLFNTMDEGFCIFEMIFDPDDKPVDCRFLEVNFVFEKQTGLHDVVGKRLREAAPAIEEIWIEVYGKIALTGEPAHFFNASKVLGRYFEVRAYRTASQLCGRLQWSLAILLSEGESRLHCGKARHG